MSEDVTATGRPRRSTRIPARLGADTSTTPSAAAEASSSNGTRFGTKRQRAPTTTTKTSTTPKKETKPKVVDKDEQLRILLQEPKSALTTLDMTDLINLSTWQALSPAARAHLSTLLPRTAFTTHKRTLHPTHPSQASASTTAFPSSSSTHPPPDSATHPPPDPDTLDPTAFTDAHTLSALRTFQDHLYTGWLTPAHARKVAEYEAGVRAGTLHAPWKDEEWAEEHQDIGASAEAEAEVEAAVPEPSARARAGDAGGWKLQDLAKRGIVRAGDVLAYRRRFSHLDLIVEKDVFIDDIHPKSHALTLVLVRGPTRALPTHVVVPGAMDTDVDEDDPALRTVTVSTAAQIESAVLDLDGRVARGMRPNGNAWKTLTVWRWREDGEGAGAGVGVDPERGGRENHNTLFYLRGCYYHEQ